jgi:hypothetical protein
MDASQLAAFKQLLQTPTLPELGPGPRAGIRAEHELSAELNGFFSRSAIPEHQQAVLRAAALLWHDHLDASHHLSQSIPDRNGSFLHAILHRREPDYSNAKYWFQQVGQHPAYGPIATRVGALIGENQGSGGVAKLVPQGQWDAFAFVDLCAAVTSGRREAGQVDLLQQIQAIEFWELLSVL